MKKLAYIVIIAICMGGCSKCKKSTNTTASGIVLDGVTGLAVPSATLFLGELEFGTYGVSGKTLAQIVSDGAGRYSFDFTGTKGADYGIVGKANGYYDTESVTDFRLKEGEKKEGFNIVMKPIATIKIHVKKTDMSYDYLSLSTYTDESGSSRSVFGYSVDSNIIYTNQKGGIYKNIYIYIEKYISGVLISQNYDTLKSIYFKPVDTTYINLNY